MKNLPSTGPAVRGACGVKLLAIAALVLVLGAAAWVLALPRVISSVVRNRTGFEVKVQQLRVNPLTANVSVRGLVVENPADWPERAFVDLREFRADAKLLSLFGDRLEVEELVVDIARVTLVRNREGKLNAVKFRDGFAGAEPAKAPAPQPRTQPQPGSGEPASAPQFLIKRMVVRLDRITYADHSGRQPRVRDYPVAIDRELADVDSVAELISPLYGANIAVVTEALGGMFADSVALLKGTGDALKDAGQKATGTVKGFLDKLKPKN